MSESSFPGRRDFLRLAAGTFVVASVPFALRERTRLVRASIPAMGASADIAVVHRDSRYAHAAMRAALSEIQRIERLMTRFDGRSDIGRANALAGRQRVSVSPETAQVVAYGLGWAQATGGVFDPAIARIVELWDVQHRTAPPPRADVARLAHRQLFRHVDVDETHASIAFSEENVALDLGGLAAGYAVDRAAGILRDWGIRDGFINVSGDIYALGVSEDGDPWHVGVRSPTDADAIIATVELSDAAIATSGDYEQFFLHKGRRYHHIMDANTAAPRLTSSHTITIQADNCMTCDVASTALFGMDAARAQQVLKGRSGGATIVA